MKKSKETSEIVLSVSTGASSPPPLVIGDLPPDSLVEILRNLLFYLSHEGIRDLFTINKAFSLAMANSAILEPIFAVLQRCFLAYPVIPLPALLTWRNYFQSFDYLEDLQLKECEFLHLYGTPPKKNYSDI